MQISLLHLDDALDSQAGFLRIADSRGAQHIDVKKLGGDVRLWGTRKALEALQAELNDKLIGSEPRLTFMGSGDFHHITSLLLPMALENCHEPVTVIHFDNHPDWVKFEGGTHCGSWVNRALEMPQVRKVITVGVCSHDLRRPEWKGANLQLLARRQLELYPYDYPPSRVKTDYGEGASYVQVDGNIRWKTIRTIGEQNFAAHLLSRIETKAVYVTVDKDVLALKDALTNWDQGKMRLPYLLNLIKEIGEHHTVIGADVNGDYSVPHYTGHAWTKFKKRAEILIDQPGRKLPANGYDTNSVANLALLQVFTEAFA